MPQRPCMPVQQTATVGVDCDFHSALRRRAQGVRGARGTCDGLSQKCDPVRVVHDMRRGVKRLAAARARRKPLTADDRGDIPALLRG